MMGVARKWHEYSYGAERKRGLKSRLFVLLRDELGLGRQPKIARLLVDEIVEVVESTLIDAQLLRPGQLIVLAPELGQGPSWKYRTLEDKKHKAVRLTLIAQEDIDRLAAGEKHSTVRKGRMVRLVRESYEQGATLTTCQLALMTGISITQVAKQLHTFMTETGEVLPLRGIVEDCSRATSHKVQIVALHLKGQSTTEIARATSHSPRSVERYIKRFEQVRELVTYMDHEPAPEVIARILCCSVALVRAYLKLLPQSCAPSER